MACKSHKLLYCAEAGNCHFGIALLDICEIHFTRLFQHMIQHNHVNNGPEF
jgi:hypothetical protein